MVIKKKTAGVKRWEKRNSHLRREIMRSSIWGILKTHNLMKRKDSANRCRQLGGKKLETDGHSFSQKDGMDHLVGGKQSRVLRVRGASVISIKERLVVMEGMCHSRSNNRPRMEECRSQPR